MENDKVGRITCKYCMEYYAEEQNIQECSTCMRTTIVYAFIKYMRDDECHCFEHWDKIHGSKK